MQNIFYRMKKANIHEPDGRKAQIYAGRCSCSPVKVDPLFVFAFRQNIFFCPASRRKHNSFERKAAGKTIQRVLRCSWFRRSRKTRKNITAAAGQQDSMTQHTLATHNYGTVNIAAQHANHNMSVDIFPMFQRCSNTAHF